MYRTAALTAGTVRRLLAVSAVTRAAGDAAPRSPLGTPGGSHSTLHQAPQQSLEPAGKGGGRGSSSAPCPAEP